MSGLTLRVGHAIPRPLLVLLFAVTVLLSTPAFGGARAHATGAPARADATTAATAGYQCYLYEPDCYHVLSGKTFGTTQSCYTYAVRYTPSGQQMWTKCIARPPSGTVYLYVFFFDCPKGKTVQYCKEHKYP